MTQVRVQGMARLQSELLALASDVKNAVEGVVMETAANLEADIKLRHRSGGRTGKTYFRGTVSHTASAPGEAPAVDVGDLLGSIYHEKVSKLSAVVGSRLEKSFYLEEGTTRIQPRPMWTPAAEAIVPSFRASMEAAIGRAVR
jgi:hypothetical protein